MTNILIFKIRKKSKTFGLAFLTPILISFLFVFLDSSCRLYKLERKLDPVNAEFLSKVRYIITKKERKIFLESSDSERERLKKEFWKRRDPDPSTEENEFKREYDNRIEKANKAFVSEGKSGWLTDRGRIFILFGPPTERLTDYSERDPYNRCQEIWYYGNFPVIFIDRACSGNFRLATYNFSPILHISFAYMQEMSRAEASAARQTITGERKFFDFDLAVDEIIVEQDRLEGLILISLPYASLWFKAVEEKLETTLEVHLELKDAEGRSRWEHRSSYNIEMEEEDLKENMKKTYKIEIPFIIDQAVEKLKEGKNKLYANLVNKTGGEELTKVMDFNIY